MASSSLILEEIITTLDQMSVNKTTIDTIKSNEHYLLEARALTKLQDSLIAKVVFIFEQNVKHNRHIQAKDSFKTLKNKISQRLSQFPDTFAHDIHHTFATSTHLRSSRFQKERISRYAPR